MGLIDWLRGAVLADEVAEGAPAQRLTWVGEPSRATADGDPDALSGEELRARREAAEELAASWPRYDLDFSVASLAGLDDLIADEFDGSPPDVDRAALRSRSPAGTVPDDATLALGTGGDATRIAAYVGETLRRSHDGTWIEADGPAQVRVRGPDGVAELSPRLLTSAAIQGHVSVERSYAALAADLGLDW